MHFINVLPYRSRDHSDIITTLPVLCYILKESDDTIATPTEEVDPSMSYTNVPCSEKAQVVDRKLELVKAWHKTLEWPNDVEMLIDSELKSL